MQRFLKRLIPFVLFGIALVAFSFGIILLAYLFLFGAIVGLILFMIAWIKSKLFPSKTIAKSDKKQSGRIIDSDDWKEL
jgi:hypothetical protein